MTDTPSANSPSASSIPADDPARALTVANPDGADVPHISVAGGTYTVLVSGAQTAGRYCLVDMLVPAGGGPPCGCGVAGAQPAGLFCGVHLRAPPGGAPPPHRHDFEEMFTLLEGELE